MTALRRFDSTRDTILTTNFPRYLKNRFESQQLNHIRINSCFLRRSIALAIFSKSSSFRLFTPSTQTNSSELFGDSLPTQTDCPPPAIKRASNYRPRDEFSCAVNGVDRFPNHEFLRRTRIEPKNQSSAIISPSGTTRKLCSVRVVWCLEKWR